MKARIAMKSILAAAALAPALAAAAPEADAYPRSLEGPRPWTVASQTGALTLTERNQVRRAVRESGILVKESGTAPEVPALVEGQVAVGKPLPAALPARLVPESLTASLPPRPGHEYWIYGDNLVLIDSASRNVVDIVRDIY